MWLSPPQTQNQGSESLCAHGSAQKSHPMTAPTTGVSPPQGPVSPPPVSPPPHVFPPQGPHVTPFPGVSPPQGPRVTLSSGVTPSVSPPLLPRVTSSQSVSPPQWPPCHPTPGVFTPAAPTSPPPRLVLIPFVLLPQVCPDPSLPRVGVCLGVGYPARVPYGSLPPRGMSGMDGPPPSEQIW